MRPGVLLLAALTVLGIVPTGSSAPTSACDGTGQLVCATATAQASVTCSRSGSTAVCSHTVGNAWAASSPLGLPGSSTTSFFVAQTYCITTCQPLSSGGDTQACGWALQQPSPCNHGGPVTSGSLSVGLAPGQCLQMTVSSHIEVQARVLDIGPALATTYAQDHASDSDAVCL